MLGGIKSIVVVFLGTPLTKSWSFYGPIVVQVEGLDEVAQPGSNLKIFGLTSGAFDALQRAGHVALAFGTPIPATPGRYFDLDLVGMAIAAGLAPTLGRPTATTIVLAFFNQWVVAVGHADADSTQNYFFAMGIVGWDDSKRRPARSW